MKVTGYVYIERTWYISCHCVGVTTDCGTSFAISSHRAIPKKGEDIVPRWSYELDVLDSYSPLTKLHKLLYGIENAD